MLRKRSIRLTVVCAVLGVLLSPLSSAAAAPATALPIGLSDWTGPHNLLSALWGVWNTPAWQGQSIAPDPLPAGNLGEVIARTGSDVDPDGCITNPDGTVTCPPPSGDPNTSPPKTQP